MFHTQLRYLNTSIAFSNSRLFHPGYLIAKYNRNFLLLLKFYFLQLHAVDRLFDGKNLIAQAFQVVNGVINFFKMLPVYSVLCTQCRFFDLLVRRKSCITTEIN